MTNNRILLLSSYEGADDGDKVYAELTRLLTRELPDIEMVTPLRHSVAAARGFVWHASISARTASTRLADALWSAYSRVLLAHANIADRIRLVFQLQDDHGNFVRVLFADPYSDKSIFMYRFEQNMVDAFGAA